MKKLILFFVLSALSCFGATRDALESWVGRPLTTAEIRFERLLVPVEVKINHEIVRRLEFRAFIEVNSALLNTVLTAEMIAAIKQADPTWDSTIAGLTLYEFSLYVEERGPKVAFQLASNFKPGINRERDEPASAEDGAIWMYFVQQFGYTDADLMNLNQLIASRI
jgi:hypothetical protein